MQALSPSRWPCAGWPRSGARSGGLRGTGGRADAPWRVRRHSPARQLPAASAAGTDAPAAAPAQPPPPPPAALPRTYKRLVARRCGQSFREVAELEEVELRLPGPGEVLVRVTYAGVNGGCETFRARGEHAFAANRQLQSFPLGAEGVGVVVALGPAAAPPAAAAGAGAGAGAARRRGGAGSGGGGLAVGQHVAVNGASAFAEYVTARASLMEGVEEAGPEAAALALSGVTACVALEATARVQPGEVVVVTAAAGGTGHLALQLARLAGGVAVAVVGGERKAEAAWALGAAQVINYRKEDVVARLRSLYPRGVDVVYEGVGGALRQQLLGCLAPGGRLLQVGYISEYPHALRHVHARTEDSSAADAASTRGSGSTSGRGGDDGGGGGSRRGSGAALPSAAAVPHSSVVFWGGLDVALGDGRRLIGNIWPKDIKSIIRCRRRVFSLARSGELRVLTDQGHGQQGVGGAAAAVDYMLRGEHVGKVVLRMSAP